jgi:hypothetical protein
MVLGAIAVVVVVVLIVMMKGGSKDSGTNDTQSPTPTPAAAKSAPAAPGSSAKAGKTPAKPAPALTTETLQQCREQQAKAQALYNEGSKARTAGDNTTARDKMAQAKVIIDQINQTLAAPMLWQEEAQMEDWTQSGEYIDLEKFVTALASLEKMVRMGGGTR